jgi:hypothetical protein
MNIKDSKQKLNIDKEKSISEVLEFLLKTSYNDAV